MNCKGQSTIEFAIVSLAVIGLVSAVLIGAYLSSFKLYSDYRIHEALVCAAQESSTYRCQNRLLKELDIFLKFGTLKKISLTKNSHKASFKMEIVFPFSRNHTWHFSESINLPLSP